MHRITVVCDAVHFNTHDNQKDRAMAESLELSHDNYLIRQTLFSLLNPTYQILDKHGNQVLFSRHKALKLKQDIHVYRDKNLSDELILIQVRKVIDFGVTYDVFDTPSQEKIGAIQYDLDLSFIFKDAWKFLDPDDQVIAMLTEDSAGRALIRRFLVFLMPHTYHVEMNGQTIITYKQKFNPFAFKLGVILAPGASEMLDPRLILAGGLILASLGGRREN